LQPGSPTPRRRAAHWCALLARRGGDELQSRVGLTPPQSRLRSTLRLAPPSSAPLTQPTPPHRQQAAVAGSTNLPDSFVKVKDGRFVVGEQCKEFYFAGWNMCASRGFLARLSPG
jgi:hypothetical protein